jgi:hypothetical protein
MDPVTLRVVSASTQDAPPGVELQREDTALQLPWIST